MIKKLAELKLVRHTPYQGVELTKSGEKIALEMVRHHRLLELFLMEALGYTWDEVHAEADVLEHVISEEFEERMAARLGYPTVDPHGDPIPAKDGTFTALKERALLAMQAGRVGADHAHQRHQLRDAALRRQSGADAHDAPHADRSRNLSADRCA